MAPKTPLLEEISPCRFNASLSSAISEWILILLLFLNGLFSYLATKLAHRCKLKPPCLFCSRFDHAIDSYCLGFYDDIICTSHKHEISSIAYCHSHNKLADIREMCETCLLSFNSDNNFDPEMYKSLVGKLEINKDDGGLIPKLQGDVECDVLSTKGDDVGLKFNLVKNDGVLGILRKRNCSCCNELFRMRSHAHRLLQTKTTEVDVVEPDGSLLGLTPRFDRSQSRDMLAKRWEPAGVPQSVAVLHDGIHDDNYKLPHIRYTELKINSDSESEVQVSDEDVRKINNSDKSQSHHLQFDNNVLEKQLYMSRQTSFLSNIAKTHGLEELSWNKIYTNPAEYDMPSSNVSNIKDTSDISEEAIKVSKEFSSNPSTLKRSQNINDYGEVQEDQKPSLSTSQGIDSPQHGIFPAPKLHVLLREDSKSSDASGISGHPNLTKRYSLDVNETGFDSSLDENNYIEFEGESPVHKVITSLHLLYKELEEERSASAIAANQAMAMITRLQEEKAAMQMEAVQYQRMMEEEADYDLQKSNDLLARKEKKIRDLESSMESLRMQIADRDDQSANDYDEEESGLIDDEVMRERNGQITRKHLDKFPLDSDSDKMDMLNDSLPNCEEEKIYISERLKELDKKLHSSSNIPENGTQFSEKTDIEDNGDGSAPSLLTDHEKQHSSTTSSIEKEITCLNDRLKCLEIDRYFLEHVIKSLQNGRQGLRFVHEIACHLREIRMFGNDRNKELVG